MSKKKTKSEKLKERRELYNTNPKMYDQDATISIAGLLAIIDELDNANAVFPNIFTGELIKQVNRTIDLMYKGNKDSTLADQHMKVASLFEIAKEKIRSV